MGVMSRLYFKISRSWWSRQLDGEIETREDFVNWAIQLASPKEKTPTILEIGPYMSPLVSEQIVDTFDVLPREELILRAISEGGPSHLIPELTWIGPEASNQYIRAKYDLVLSSHVVEHQIDFIAHLQNIESLLHPGGYYAALIPDHRFCFDYYNLPSSIVDILLAHIIKEKNHSLKNFLEDRLTTGHNETMRYWRKDFGIPKINGKSYVDVLDLVAEYQSYLAKGIYVDVHAWKFTDQTFVDIFSRLKEMSLTNFTLTSVIPAKFGNNEFWVLFQKKS
jgi:hypothetical protein